MSRLSIFASIGLAVAGVTTVFAASPGEAGLRVVIQLSDPNPQVIEVGIKNAVAILQEAKSDGGLSDLKVIVLGPALKFFRLHDSVTLSAGARKNFETLRSERHVQFYACRNTMTAMGIQLADLMAGFKTVPSGAYEILRLQRQGYRYFRP